MPTPTIPINNVQERVERSIFEAIRLKLVAHGYIPDVNSFAQTPVGNTAYTAAMQAIVTGGQPDSIEVYNNGSQQSKAVEVVPRIVCVTRRIMPGDIGKRVDNRYTLNPLDPDAIVDTEPPYESSNLHIDIEVISKSARHDRILHAILAEAIGGTMGYVNVYDTKTNERFFIRQFNFYDLPDMENGLLKRVYSYEVPDIYLTDGMNIPNPSLIKQITAQLNIVSQNSQLTAVGTIIGPYAYDGTIFIDLSGISFTA